MLSQEEEIGGEGRRGQDRLKAAAPLPDSQGGLLGDSDHGKSESRNVHGGGGGGPPPSLSFAAANLEPDLF